jgi:hypothetical protein
MRRRTEVVGWDEEVVMVNYRSHRTLFGLPLVHLASGQVVDGRYKRGIARGWIAVGDISLGILFSMGGVACGGISIGGVGLGLITISGVGLGLIFCVGGLALGGYAVGGLAIGGIAVGGGAIALYDAEGGLAIAGHAASGGLAIASQYAVGGEARAAHANDPPAREYMATSPVRFGRILVGPWSWVVFVLIFGSMVLLGFLGKKIAAKPPPPDQDWGEQV